MRNLIITFFLVVLFYSNLYGATTALVCEGKAEGNLQKIFEIKNNEINISDAVVYINTEKGTIEIEGALINGLFSIKDTKKAIIRIEKDFFKIKKKLLIVRGSINRFTGSLTLMGYMSLLQFEEKGKPDIIQSLDCLKKEPLF